MPWTTKPAPGITITLGAYWPEGLGEPETARRSTYPLETQGGPTPLLLSTVPTYLGGSICLPAFTR